MGGFQIFRSIMPNRDCGLWGYVGVIDPERENPAGERKTTVDCGPRLLRSTVCGRWAWLCWSRWGSREWCRMCSPPTLSSVHVGEVPWMVSLAFGTLCDQSSSDFLHLYLFGLPTPIQKDPSLKFQRLGKPGLIQLILVGCAQKKLG